MTLRTVRLPLCVAASFAVATLAVQGQPTPAAPASNPTAPVPVPVRSPAPVAAAAARPEEELVKIKLIDDTVDQVLALLEMYTGRTIIRPAALPTANPGYTLNIRTPIPKSEAILALETLLSLNQIGVAPDGDRFLKVVPLAQVRTEAPEFISGSALDLPPSGKVASKIFQFDFLRAAEFIPQLTAGGIFTPGIGGGVVVLDKANAAMVTDTVTNLQRVEMLLRQLDRPVTAGMTPKFYPVQHAKASDLVSKLRGVISGPLQAQLGTATTFNADDRTNQIVLLADPRQHPFFDDLIARLDIKSDPNTRNEVIPLKHAVAKDIQTLLNTLVQGQNAAAQRSAAQSVRAGQITLPNQPVLPNQPGPPGAPAGAGASNGGADIAPSNEFSGIVTVVNDDRSNAIIVSGTSEDVRIIKELVSKLDTLLAQVRIEVVVAEVTLTDSDVSGISALNLTVGTDNPATGDSGRGTHITNFGGTVAGWAVTSGVVNPLAFQAALSDAGNRSILHVLSAPTIVTTHGKQGEVVVGQSTPVVSGVTTTPSVTASTTSSFASQATVTYKDVNLDLKVTPLIGDDGSIQLTIDQKIDDIVGNVTIPNVGDQPIVGHREATSTINVFDSQMIVLGGLQRSSVTRSRSKLGFIFEIPVLSNLLGNRTKTTQRTELLLFIRPHVIPAQEGTPDTRRLIDQLSNKDQINQFLKDPSKLPKENLKEKFQ